MVSFSLFFIITRFRILNPRYDGWLSEGDGVLEIAWEFYRNTEFPLWLIGNLDGYGMEMARPAFYMLPTFFAFPLRIFSILLGERFQFVGLMILISFILHFFFSSKIFKIFRFNKLNNILASSLLLITPIMLYRLIDHTHYTLSQNWIILAVFYFVFKKELSPFRWAFLFAASILIFPYYIVFISSIFTIFILINLYSKNISIIEILKITSGIIFSMLVSLIVSGYFFFGNRLQPDTQVTFKANVNSLLNPFGWSRIIEDRFLGPGEYEGFGFLGFHFLFLGFVMVILILKKLLFKNRINFPYYKSFIILTIPSLSLAFISLSNEIHLNDALIFSYSQNFLLEFINTNFRSIGRFIWLIVYVISVLILCFLASNLKPKRLSLLLTFTLAVGIYDIYPKLTSQTNQKFSLSYSSPLKSSFWRNLSPCYKNIISVPPSTSAEYLFPIAKFAYAQNMNIFPAAIPRVPPDEQLALQKKLRNKLASGNLDESSIYIFQPAAYISEEITNLDKEITINTMSGTSRAGTINNVFVIAPDFENCEDLFNKYSQKLPIKKQSSLTATNNYLSFKNSAYDGFNLISGWSVPETWGVWTAAEKSRLIVQAESLENKMNLVISGHRFEFKDGTSPEMRIYINGEETYYAMRNKNKFDEVSINLKNIDTYSNTFVIDFEFSELSSPLEQYGLNDERPLGFALKSIEFK